KINNGIYFHDKTESAVQIRKQDPVIDKANAGCYVTVAVRGKQEFIIAELDSEIRKIRLKLTDSYEEGVKLSSGTFTLPARFCREILPDDVRSITILLEKSDDDWWYGSY
ncbi:hypothetical protein, partial [Escherichia sp. 8.2195]|uniref:hypothetical protein n=1 Tax=Escherichia sp. 8.2195 TaxID=2723303 RepID=UPI00188769C6